MEAQLRENALNISLIFAPRLSFHLGQTIFHESLNGTNDRWTCVLVWQPPVVDLWYAPFIGHLVTERGRVYVTVTKIS